MIYLPAADQETLVRGIDALSAPGSQVGIEGDEPMPDHVFQLLRSAERADDSGDLNPSFS